jgi:predicted RNA-binding protein with PUA-like domain
MKDDKNFWLMKSEPLEYSIDDLKQDRTTFWFGVRNYQVRNMFRDNMKVGDLALFYHSNAGKETGVVGVMRVIKKASTDPTQFEVKSKYFDPKSTNEKPRWLGVGVKFVKKLSRLVSLSEIKANHAFIDLPLVKKGNRLSVMPISEKQFNRLVELGDK